MFEIRRVTAENVNLNLLVYGLPGVGKTTLALQANDHPAMAPALLLNLEGGELSVASRNDVDQIRITSMDLLSDIIKALYGGSEQFRPYKTIVVDSGSEMAKMSLAAKVALGVERTSGKQPDRTIDDVQMEDYGKMLHEMRRLFGALRDHPTHTVITSLARFKYRTGQNADTGTPISIGPDFTAGLSSAVVGMFDFVWYAYVSSDGTRAIQTARAGVIEAKTRGPRFADTIGLYVGNPYLPDLYNALLATEGGSGSPIPEAFIPRDEMVEEGEMVDAMT